MFKMAKTKKKTNVVDKAWSAIKKETLNVATSVKKDATKSVNLAIENQIIPAAQNFANQGLVLMVNKLLEAIPSPEEISKISDKISNMALNYMHSDIVPKILITRSGVQTLEGFEQPDLYETVMSKIPTSIQLPAFSGGGFVIPSVTFNLQASMRNALPKHKFEELSKNTKDIVIENFKTNVVPDAKKLATNTATTLFFVGAVSGTALCYLVGKAISYNDPYRYNERKRLRSISK